MGGQTLKIAVFGAGSIGCYLGGRLISGGADVTFIGRKRYQEALRENGLRLTHFEQADRHIPYADFTFALQASALKSADCVLVAVKSQDTEAAGQALAKHMRPDALVVSLQNGIGNADILQKALPDHTVLGAVVPFNVTSPAAGQFHCGVAGAVAIASAQHTALAQLIEAFERGEQDCAQVDDIAGVQWAKLLINLNNALNTLAGGPLMEGFASRDYRRAWALCMEEGLSVLTQAGITPSQFGPLTVPQMIKMLRLPTWLYMFILKRRVTVDATARSSMQDDLELGRAPEIAYLQGEIMRVAEQTGQAALYNSKVYALIEDAFKEGQSPRLSGTEILTVLKAV